MSEIHRIYEASLRRASSAIDDKEFYEIIKRDMSFLKAVALMPEEKAFPAVEAYVCHYAPMDGLELKSGDNFLAKPQDNRADNYARKEIEMATVQGNVGFILVPAAGVALAPLSEEYFFGTFDCNGCAGVIGIGLDEKGDFIRGQDELPILAIGHIPYAKNAIIKRGQALKGEKKEVSSSSPVRERTEPSPKTLVRELKGLIGKDRAWEGLNDVERARRNELIRLLGESYNLKAIRILARVLKDLTDSGAGMVTYYQLMLFGTRARIDPFLSALNLGTGDTFPHEYYAVEALEKISAGRNQSIINDISGKWNYFHRFQRIDASPWGTLGDEEWEKIYEQLFKEWNRDSSQADRIRPSGKQINEHFKNFGLSKDVPQDIFNKKARTTLMENHPDRHMKESRSSQEYYEGRIKTLIESYEAIKNWYDGQKRNNNPDVSSSPAEKTEPSPNALKGTFYIERLGIQIDLEQEKIAGIEKSEWLRNHNLFNDCPPLVNHYEENDAMRLASSIYRLRIPEIKASLLKFARKIGKEEDILRKLQGRNAKAPLYPFILWMARLKFVTQERQRIEAKLFAKLDIRGMHLIDLPLWPVDSEGNVLTDLIAWISIKNKAPPFAYYKATKVSLRQLLSKTPAKPKQLTLFQALSSPLNNVPLHSDYQIVSYCTSSAIENAFWPPAGIRAESPSVAGGVPSLPAVVVFIKKEQILRNAINIRNKAAASPLDGKKENNFIRGIKGFFGGLNARVTIEKVSDYNKRVKPQERFYSAPGTQDTSFIVMQDKKNLGFIEMEVSGIKAVINCIQFGGVGGTWIGKLLYEGAYNEFLNRGVEKVGSKIIYEGYELDFWVGILGEVAEVGEGKIRKGGKDNPGEEENGYYIDFTMPEASSSSIAALEPFFIFPVMKALPRVGLVASSFFTISVRPLRIYKDSKSPSVPHWKEQNQGEYFTFRAPLENYYVKDLLTLIVPRWKELYWVLSLFYLSVAGGETDFTAFQRGIAGGDKIPARADKLNPAGSASPLGWENYLGNNGYFDFGWVWVSLIFPFVFGFIRMFKEDNNGGNIYCPEERMKIASRMEEAKALEEEADGYVSMERWNLAYRIYELALRCAIKSENVIWYKDLEIKFNLAKVKIIYDAYLSMDNRARMKNISCLYAVVESLTKVINRRPADIVKLEALRGLRDVWRRIYQDNRNKKASQEATVNAVKFVNRVLLLNPVYKGEDLEVLGDIYLEISNIDRALSLYTQALSKYNGFSGKIKQAALQRKIERISGRGHNSSSPMNTSSAFAASTMSESGLSLAEAKLSAAMGLDRPGVRIIPL